MSPDVVKEFLVRLGFSVDDTSAKRAEATAARVEKATTAADQRTTSHLSRGAVARANAALKEAGVRNASIEQIIAKAEELQATDKAATSAAVANADVRTSATRAASQAYTRFAASVVAAFAQVSRLGMTERERTQADLRVTLRRSVIEAKTTEDRVAQAEKLIAVDRRKGAVLLRTVLRQGVADAKSSADKAKWLQKLSDLDKADTQATQARAEKRRDAVKGYGLAVTGVVTGIASAATAATFMIERMAAGLERTYYAARRTGASAGGIRSFGYAAGQLGSSPEEAIGSIEALALKRRQSPGYDTMLNNMGVDTLDKATGKARKFEDVMLDLGDVLRKMPGYQQRAYANALSIPENLLTAITDPRMRQLKAENDADMAIAGLDPEKADRDSKKFMDVWRRLLADIEIIRTKVQGALVAAFGDQIEDLRKSILANSDAIAKGLVRAGEMILRLITSAGDLVKAFGNLSPETRGMATQIAALAAAFLLFNAGPLGALTALTVGIVALYDDYKKWKEGSTDTLIDWGKWGPGIEKLLSFIGTDGALYGAFAAFGGMLLLKVLGPLNSILKLIPLLLGTTLPGWILRLLGVSAAASASVSLSKGGAAAGIDPITGAAPGEDVGSGLIEPGKEGGGRRWLQEKYGAVKDGVKRLFGGGPAEAHTGGGEGGGEGIRARARRALVGDQSGGVAANPGAYKDVLDHIARSEGTANRAGGGYNTSLGYGRYLPGGKEQNLTGKTLDEILELGNYMRRQPGNPNSSAMGRYQIVGSTLRDQMRKLGLKGSDLFDEKTQDRIAANLARQRGADAAGLRQEWASLVGAKNATAVALMQKVNPKASTMPLDRPAPPAPQIAEKSPPQPAGTSTPQVAKSPVTPSPSGGTLAERAAAGYEYGPQTPYPNSRSLKQMNEEFWNNPKGRQPIDWKKDPETGNWKPVFDGSSAKPEGLQRGLDAQKNFNERFNNAPAGQPIAPALVSPPLGSSPAQGNTKNITMHFEGDKTTVTGVSDPHEASRAIARINDRQNADLLENMQGAFA